MSSALTEEERLRRKKAQEDLPPLPPLLAQILAQTRAKQQQKALAAEKGGVAGNEGEDVNDTGDDEAKLASGPLFLEAAPSNGLIVMGTNLPPPKQPGEESDSDSEAEAGAKGPPGPLDPARCRAHGPGFSGAAAGQPVKLTITARDSHGKRIREGGAHILVMVEPAVAPGQEEEPEPIQADIVDHGDGTYTASYIVPNKGNYQLHIEVNGDPLGDSPYPIFFSAPQPMAEPAPAPVASAPQQAAVQPALPSGVAMPVPTVTAGGIQIVTAAAIKEAQQAAAGQVAAAVAPGTAALAAAYPNMGAGMHVSLGAQLAQMGMKFPALLPEQAMRMVVVGGIGPHTNAEALKSVFAFCGTIRSCTLAGPGSGFAFIEFSSAHEATAAMAMSGVQLMGQALKIELALEAQRAAEAAATTGVVANPFIHLQAQQVQQFQLLHQQQAALAEQVLAMRAAQRLGVHPSALPASYRSLSTAAAGANAGDTQKSAAMAAAVALSKKLADGGDAANGGGKERSRSRERRRSRSRDRRRSRSRDRRRRRSRSRDRRRSKSRDRKGRSRSRDRRRSNRSRSREHKRSHRERKEERRDRRRSRSRSRGRDGKRSSSRPDKDAGGKEAAAAQMDVDAVPPAAQAAAPAQDSPKDELEALLEELGD